MQCKSNLFCQQQKQLCIQLWPNQHLYAARIPIKQKKKKKIITTMYVVRQDKL